MASGVPGVRTVFAPGPVVEEPGAPVENATSQSKKGAEGYHSHYRLNMCQTGSGRKKRNQPYLNNSCKQAKIPVICLAWF